MGWKEFPLWLKSGIVGAVLVLLPFLYIFIADFFNIITESHNLLTGTGILVLLGAIPFVALAFGVGAVIGLLVQKIKYKK